MTFTISSDVSSIDFNSERIDLELPTHRSLRDRVISCFYRYCSYPYLGLDRGQISPGSETAVLLSSKHLSPLTSLKRISKKHRPILNTIRNTIKEHGFKFDESGNYYHLETGTIFNLIFDCERNEVVIAFMGLNHHRFLSIADKEKNQLCESSYRAASRDWGGYDDEASEQAINLGRQLKEIVKETDLKLVMVGHSHGGGLAQTAALANGIKGVVFNPRPMGAATQRKIGKETLRSHAHLNAIFCVKEDWLNDSPTANGIGSLLETWGFTVPRNVGTTYYLPSVNNEHPLGSHGGFYQSFTKLKELQETEMS